MIKRISQIMTSVLMKNSLNNKKIYEEEIYQYGFEIALSSILNCIIVLGIGLIFQSILSSVIFLSCFYLVRRQTGGYHAKSYCKCNVIFGFTFTSVMIFSYIANYNNVIMLILFLCCLLGIVYVCKYAPVSNKYKSLTKKQKTQSHKLAMGWYLISFLVGCIICCYSNKLYGAVIFTTLLSIVVLMFCEIVTKNGGEQSV